MDAFWSFYTANSLENISISEITQQAGIHRSTFYRYFPDRYAVLEAIEEELLAQLEPIFDQPSLDQIPQRFHALYGLIQSHGHYLMELVGLRRDVNFLQKIKKMALSQLNTLIEELIGDLNQEQKEVLLCSAGGIWMTFLLQALHPNLTEEKTQRMLVHLIFEGYLPGLQTLHGVPLHPEIAALQARWLEYIDQLAGGAVES